MNLETDEDEARRTELEAAERRAYQRIARQRIHEARAALEQRGHYTPPETDPS